MSALSEAVLLKILDAGLNALAVGVTREDVLAKVSAQLAAGVKPEEIPAMIVRMRDEALAKAQAQADGA